MNVIKRTAASVVLLLLALTAPARAQQKRPTPKPQPPATAVPTPAPTFDTLVPASSYTIYGEVRGAGQVVRSSALIDLLEPILKLSGPPEEFKTVVKWLTAHSEEIMTSRLLVAAWPTVNAKQAPQTLIAIEFASAEDATKFAGTLNEFLPKIMPAPTPEPSPKSADGTNTTDKSKPVTPPDPGFHVQRMGSLIVITERPWTMKQLKPTGSKLLAEDPNFRAARNRFSTEPLFLYLDTKAMEREETERQKHFEEERRAEEEKIKREQAEAKTEPKKSNESEEPAFVPQKHVEPQLSTKTEIASEGTKESQEPDSASMALTAIGSAFFQGETSYPDGVAFALSFEGDSFDLRALLVNQSGAKADALPFVPLLITGPALSPEAPNIFPADTELLATMSLDLPQIYAAMSKPQLKPVYIRSQGPVVETKEVQPESPFAAIEQRLKISLKDDLLPLLGSEVAVRLPMKDANIIGMPGVGAGAPNTTTDPQPNKAAPVLAIAVKDKEGLRALMPKLIDSLGFKGASSLMQTERREDTELVSFGDVVGYAFVGNFIVISSDVAATRYVVDSYLKHETLSSDIQFKNSIRWQPRPLHGELYISPALMDGLKAWTQQSSVLVTDQVRSFLTRAGTVSQPITYSLSNEGLGPLHELHIPKNLILMAVTGISGEVNPTPVVQNERMAMGMMYQIVGAEEAYKQKNAGAYGTLEELMAADLIPKDTIEKSGYRFDLSVSGDKFEVSAVPLEYGKSGRLSLFLDQTHIIRGGDKSGASASASDPPIN
jgi:hypothetical protein